MIDGIILEREYNYGKKSKQSDDILVIVHRALIHVEV